MAGSRASASGSHRPLAVPLAVFAALGALTAAVWWQQVDHQRELLTRHTEDVCVQASRRAEVFLQSHLAVAEVFARRWASHEEKDRTRHRCDELGAQVINEQPGYRAVGFVAADSDEAWVVPADNRSLVEHLAGDGRALLETSRRERTAVLSPPVQSATKERSLFAALPASRNGELLGYLVFELSVTELFGQLYHQRIRSEFGFSIDDGDQELFRYGPDVPASEFLHSRVKSEREFSVWNRRWRMTVVPRPAELASVSWRGNLLIPGFGLVLSIGLSVLSGMLMQRTAAYRRARDEALVEVRERRETERALRASEARYRSVFDSATEGLLVLDLQGRILEANDAACVMHGYAPGSLNRRPVRQLIAEDHQHKYDEFMAVLKRAGTVSLESVDVCHDGSRIDVEVRGTRFTHDGQPAALAILMDVTERNAALRQQLRLSRQVLVVQEEERARLSRDLHDQLGQTLTALRFELDWLSRNEGDGSVSDGGRFSQAIRLVETSAQELRRMCKGLRPPLLDDLGLVPAVRQLVEDFQQHSGLAVELEVSLDEDELPITPEIALCAYRILQEALTNVHRHARAKHVDVTVAGDAQGLKVSVYDDGRGFELTDPATHTRFGIAGMRERAKLVDGSIEIRSVPGEGTRVVLRVPRPSHSVIPTRDARASAAADEEAS